MKTINQINGRLAANQTIDFYFSLCQKYETWTPDYRNRHFNFKYKFEGREEVRNITPAGNFIYGAAMSEFHRIIGAKKNEGYNYGRDNKQAYFEIDFSGYVLQFQIRTEQGLKGVFLSLETNFKAIQDRNAGHLPLCHSNSHKIRSNSTFAALPIQEYFEKKILPKYLFAPGLFRNIQIVKNCTKAEAIEFYKKNIAGAKPSEAPDTYKAICRQIKRRLNIEVKDDFSNKFLLLFLKQTNRSKTQKKLFRSPNMFELSDHYCSQYDTDGHEEEFLDEVFNDYPKNAIFA